MNRQTKKSVPDQFLIFVAGFVIPYPRIYLLFLVDKTPSLSSTNGRWFELVFLQVTPKT